MEIRKAKLEDAAFMAWTVLTALDMDTSDLEKATDVCTDDFGLYSWKNALIAEEDGKPIGCIISYPGDKYLQFREYTWPKLWTDIDPDLMNNTPYETLPGEYYLDSMAILPKFRGKSIGKNLMMAAIQNGKAMGCDRFALIVDVDKPQLHDYYGQLGFRDSGPIQFFTHLFTKMIKQ
ncbi:MAG: GNAT family N-acetyltransferase [Muribaculum sp.]|nr:GNAT family N-acetyltransferase [Muribaculum sp.]